MIVIMMTKDDHDHVLTSPQSAPIQPLVQTQEPEMQKPWPEQRGSAQSAGNSYDHHHRHHHHHHQHSQLEIVMIITIAATH